MFKNSSFQVIGYSSIKNAIDFVGKNIDVVRHDPNLLTKRSFDFEDFAQDDTGEGKRHAPSVSS